MTQAKSASDRPFFYCFIPSLLLVFALSGCGRGPDRVVGETAEWTFEDYKKARDAGSSGGDTASENADGTKP